MNKSGGFGPLQKVIEMTVKISLEPVELEKCITDAVCLRWGERLTKY